MSQPKHVSNPGLKCFNPHCVYDRFLQPAASARLEATDGITTLSLTSVAIGNVLLCGGQSNMGFGMYVVVVVVVVEFFLAV